MSCHVTLQLVEGQEGGQLLDLNQHEFHLMTGYEVCVWCVVCVCVVCVGEGEWEGRGE